jgi:hypothetical protein
VKTKADALGIAVPSYAIVKHRIAQHGREQRSAGRHGVAAAVHDAQVVATVPCEYVHEIYTLDEFLLPAWVRAWYRAERRYISIRPWVVVLQDYLARPVVAWHLCDPARLGVDSAEPLGRYDSDDVLATLLTGACPELAPDSTADFSGRLMRVLRWDNHSTHEALRERIRRIGIRVPDLPVARPKNRGVVEALIKTLKRWCEGLNGVHGHINEYLPTDRTPDDITRMEDLEALRTEASARGERVPRRDPMRRRTSSTSTGGPPRHPRDAGRVRARRPALQL